MFESATLMALKGFVLLKPVRLVRVARFVCGTIALAVAYYAAGRASLALQYTGPVAAIWLPVGVAAATLYLAGLRWWPGVLIADLALADPAQPLGTALGITAGNMADILVIAVLLRRLLGPRVALDRLEHVAGILIAIATGAAITATIAVASMRAGGVLGSSDMATFWRSWLLADASGALVMIPLVLAWARPPASLWRGRRALEGALMTATIVVLSAIALSGDLRLTYIVFPALTWAALRLGQQGATLAIAAAAASTVSITAGKTGAFVASPISESTLSTQLYVAVASLTTLCLVTIVAERRRAALQLTESKRGEVQRAAVERERIARDLHDSVSQSLYSGILHLRTAERALAREGVDPAGTVGRELEHVTQLTSGALAEMRSLVSELRPGALTEEGLVATLVRHAAAISAREELTITVDGPQQRLPLTAEAEEQLYRLAQEALANIVKHAQAQEATIIVTRGEAAVAIAIGDDGRGFDVDAGLALGFGLRSMRDRSGELDGRLQIMSAPGRGTLVDVEIPVSATHDER